MTDLEQLLLQKIVRPLIARMKAEPTIAHKMTVSSKGGRVIGIQFQVDMPLDIRVVEFSP